jgi:hypothetical protein
MLYGLSSYSTKCLHVDHSVCCRGLSRVRHYNLTSLSSIGNPLNPSAKTCWGALQVEPWLTITNKLPFSVVFYWWLYYFILLFIHNVWFNYWHIYWISLHMTESCNGHTNSLCFLFNGTVSIFIYQESKFRRIKK